MSYEALLSAQQTRPPLFATRHGQLGLAHNAEPAQIGASHTLQKVQTHDEGTLGSGSGSGISNISELEDETDTLGRAIMQHERDAGPFKNVLNTDQQPLLKARARPRVSELIEREEREEKLASGRHHYRVGSFGSNDSEPPLNVPREWGTRAKSHRGWMRRIREPSEAGLIPTEDAAYDQPRTDFRAATSHRTAYSRATHRSSPADEGLPEMEETPPSMTRSRTSSQPASLRHANNTLRHILDSEDQDFSDLSLLASTPAFPRTQRTIGGPAQRDVYRTEREQYPDRKSGQLSLRSPNGSLRRRRSREAAAEAETSAAVEAKAYEPRPVTAPPASFLSRAAHRRGLIGKKENVPTNGANGSQYGRNETVTITDHTAQAVTSKQSARPTHNRNDSMKLLQRLARVSSMSPSPGRPSPENAHVGVDKPSPSERTGPSYEGSDRYGRSTNTRLGLRDVGTFSTRSRRRSPESQNQEVDEQEHQQNGNKPRQTEKKSTSSAAEETQSNRMSRNELGVSVDRRARHESLQFQAGDSTTLPAQEASSGTAPARNANAPKEQNTEEQQSQRVSDRPRSALEDIMLEARNNPGGPFGDATIQSLDDIAHPNLDGTDTTLTIDASASGAEDNNDAIDSQPLTQAEKDRRQENFAIGAMNKHLRAARTSIKDADRGLRRVENKVDITHTEAAEPATQPTQPERTKSAEPAESTLVLTRAEKPIEVGSNWRTECKHCGGSYRSVWRALWVELRSNFYDYDRTARFGFRLTWLGIMILTWFVWHLTENVLCEFYCHPLYATKMVGYGVDPDAPRYPFVIPTLAFRPLRPVWRPVINWLEEAFTALFNLVFGEPEKKPVPLYMRPGFKITPGMINWKAVPPYDGSQTRAWESKWTGGVVSSTVAAAARATRSFIDAVDEIGFMGDDEWLT